MQLTPEQAAAAHFDGGDLCVVAGAGTGKTRVLVERVVYLIQKRQVPADSILAITFTEKAAEEMQQRLAARLPNGDFRGTVGTIHGFCHRLLREFHALADLGADFGVAAPLQGQYIRFQVLDELVERWERDRQNDLQLLAQSLAWQGGDKVRGWRNRVAATLLPFYDALRADTDPTSINFYSAPNSDRLKIAEAQVPKLLNALLDAGGPELNAAKRTDLEAALALLKNAGSQTSKFAALAALTQALGGRWSDALRAQRDELRTIVTDLSAMLWQIQGKPVYEALQRFVADFDALYRTKKRLAGLVDYDDLQLFAEKLLKDRPTVLKEMRRRHPYLLVDEFQDVSPIQNRLVELLATPGKLFLVGDVRQSIYGFRYADLHSFAAMQQRFAAGSGRSFSLTENFRSQPELIALLNDFTQVHGKTLGEGISVGEPLRAAAEATSTQSSVNMLLTDGDSAAVAREREAQAVTQIIRHWAEKGDIAYSDVAILFRSSGSMAPFREALTRAGIPSVSSAGGGFYATREVQDTLTCMRLALAPSLEGDQELALAAALKSPYGAVTDGELHTLLAAKTPETSLWDSLENQSGAPADFYRWFEPLRQRAATLSVYELMEAIVLNSHVEGRLHEPQQRANLDKLLSMGLLWDQRPPGGAADFLEMCESLLAADVREEQASVPEQTGAVRLMTVHAAKGLEFPAVIVADLTRDGGGGADSLLCDRHGNVGIRLKDGDNDTVSTSAYTAILAAKRESERAEEQRVLYVALSRARRQLMLSAGVASGKNSSKPTGWLKLLAAQFPLQDLLAADAAATALTMELQSFSGDSALQLTFV